MTFWRAKLAVEDDEFREVITFVPDVGVLVVVEEVETWLVAQIVEVGHVSTAKELLFRGSSSDWLPRDKTDPQLIVPLEDPLQSSKESETFHELVVDDNG